MKPTSETFWWRAKTGCNLSTWGFATVTYGLHSWPSRSIWIVPGTEVP